MGHYLDQKLNFAPAINELNEEIIKKIGKGNSIQSKVLCWYGKRGFELKFSGNIIDGKFNENTEVSLFDPLGNQITDGNEINKYLHTLSNKIKNKGLDKKKGLLSGFFDILGNAVNGIEDVSRILTKTLFNNFCVGLLTYVFDSCRGTKIYQNLNDKQYFSLFKETKGLARLVDPSYLVSNLAFKPARPALKFLDRGISLLLPLYSRSYYLPIVDQSDIDEIAKKNTTEKGSSKGISDGHEAHTTPARSKSLPNRPRPNMHQSKRSKSVGQTPSPYWTPQTDHKPHDPFSSYQNPYYPLLAPTRDLPQNTRSFSGGRYGLTPEQTSALFMEAIGSSKSSNSQNSRVYGGGGKVTPPMSVHHPRGLYDNGTQNRQGVGSAGGRGSGRGGGR
jgi:hypothetical protein